ncbi:CPBP family glutamic-type intramembrane protease [Calidifontibacter indicus]|uniref:CPBP family glutamic-type intramembrane protease n=1 Tax=Calidifontibacter indicus TaxID=419650 RepID=UPI003D74E7B8
MRHSSRLTEIAGRLKQLPWLRPVERDHWQTPAEFRRRQLVSLGTLVVGAPVLRTALRQPPGSRSFQLWTVALAGVWTAGALASGPLHVGHSNSSRGPVRPIVRPLAIGSAAVAVFTLGGMAVVQVPLLRKEIESVVQHARVGDLRIVVPLTIATGAAEELFFRGALYAATPQPHQVAVTTVVYGTTTLATGNPMLVFASVLLGGLTGVSRRVTGGVLSPIIVHGTWSTGMLVILPKLTERAAAWGELLLSRRSRR